MSISKLIPVSGEVMAMFYLTTEINLEIKEVLNRLPFELEKKGFTIINTAQIDQHIEKSLGIQCFPYTVLNIINPALMYRAMHQNKIYGLLMPLQMAVWPEQEKTKAAFIRPSLFTHILGDENLREGAAALERKLNDIISALQSKRFQRGSAHQIRTILNRESAMKVDDIL